MKHILLFFLLILSFEKVVSGTFHVKLQSSAFQQQFEKFCEGKMKIKKLYSFPKKIENVFSSSSREFEEKLSTYYTVTFDESLLSPQTFYLLSFVEFVIPTTKLQLTSLRYSTAQNNIDPLLQEQWYLDRIGVPSAWKESSGQGVLIGVIDTGIEENHPDLQKNLWINSKEDINNNGKIDPYASSIELNGVFGDFDGIDNDGNGFIDDVIGYDFVDQDLINSGDYTTRDGYPSDERGHGTSVTGIIAAEKDNGIGIAGIAHNAKVMTLRAFDITGNGQDDDVAASIIYATLNGVHILNCSFGDVFKSPLVEDAIQFAIANNVVVVVSAGNERASFDRYPANIGGVISVSATTDQDRSASFSSFGNFISLAAPGVNIVTTDRNGRYQAFAGTSASAPIVSAVVALVLEKNPNLRPNKIKSLLESSSEDIGTPGWDVLFGAGLVNAKNAVEGANFTLMSIESPRQEQLFLREHTSTIPITISSMNPLFEQCDIYWGYGNNPTNWTVMYTAKVQERNKQVTQLKTTELQDSTIVLRLVVTLKNNRTIEHRTKIFLYSKESLQLTSYNVFPSQYGSTEQLYVHTKFNYPVRNSVERITSGTSIFSTNQLFVSNEFFHKVGTVTDNSVEQIRIKAYLPQDSIVLATTFSTNPSIIPERSIQLRSQTLPPAYISPKVYPLYGNTPTVFLNDFSNGNWGQLRTYTFENQQFIAKDSLEKNWVPRAMGNTNGNRLNEVLIQEFGKTILFEQTEENGNPFSRIIFSDTIEQNFWGVGLEDIDGDGIDDIIGFNDSALVVKSFKNNVYIDLYIFTNPSKGSSFSGRKYVFGNFDTDANKEIAFVDFDADLSIFEISPTGIKLEYFLERDGIEATQMIASGDLDGDGIDEIVSGFSTSERITTFRKPTTPFWNFHIVKFKENNFLITDTLIVSDVRIGGPFFNSVTIEKIDSTNKKKILFSLFPYCYVYGFENEQLKPLGLTFSNSPSIARLPDNSFLVNRGDSSVRYSLSSNALMEAPVIYDGYVTNGNEATIQWIGNSVFDSYNLVIIDQDNLPVVDTVVKTTKFTTTVLPNSQYRCLVFGLTSKNDTSLPSSVYTFVSTPQIQAQSVTTHSKNTVKITYSGRISPSNHQPNFYTIQHKVSNQLYPVSSANPFGDNEVLLSTYSVLDSGEYTVKVTSFRDFFGNPTVISNVEFRQTQESNDFHPFFLNFSQLQKDNSLIIGFSEPFEVNSAIESKNYTAQPYGTVSSVTLIDSSSILVRFSDAQSPFASGRTYYLTANNVLNRNQTTVVDTTVKIAFVISTGSAENSYFYPNPFVMSKEKTGFFANIPQNSIVEIYTIDGQLKQTLTEKNGNGGIEWDGRGFTGEKLPVGIYVFKVRNELTDWKESDLKKLLIK